MQEFHSQYYPFLFYHHHLLSLYTLNCPNANFSSEFTPLMSAQILLLGVPKHRGPGVRQENGAE